MQSIPFQLASVTWQGWLALAGLAWLIAAGCAWLWLHSARRGADAHDRSVSREMRQHRRFRSAMENGRKTR